ncbi:MAG: trypsin-like peptidase domain-containing protein, partial [Clostridia bacterium]|nr:trypsin-like peptidase domain-containing protein [Clostridia bacterium]
QPLNNPQQPLNNQNPQNQPPQQNSYWREYPYGNQQNPNQNRPNPYANQPLNNQPQNNQPLNHQPYYGAPQQNGGQISYTPSYKKEKKKNTKPVTRGGIAVLCVLMLILSAGAGFGGAMLASRVYPMNSASADHTANSAVSNSSDPVVIYKNVEDVATSTSTTSGENLTFSQVAAMVKDSVVEIVTEFNNQSMWYQYVTQGAGSGVVISADGHIITNAHVITNESTGAIADNIIVRLTDASEYTAEAIAYDADSDIAILKIEAEGLQPALCGDSDSLAVGEDLVVVGNPLGELGGTVTNGIVSATQREIQMGGVTMSLIQTNAAVNPGNSGGGMFNMKGQLVGIVNAKSSGTGIEGLGFAIPINYALEISEQLLDYGYVRGKTMIGVAFQDVSGSNFFFYYDIKSGVYVAELSEGYNDDVLEVGDRIIAVNGKEITSSSDIKAVVSSCSVGDKIKFQLYREDKLMEVEVTCFERVPEQKKDVQFEEGTTEGKNGSEGVLPSGMIEEFFFGGR